MGLDLVSIVESAYELEQDTSAWLDGLLARLEPWIGDGIGLFGFEYSVTEAAQLKPDSVAMRGCSETMLEELPSALVEVGPDLVRDVYLSADCGVATQSAGWESSVASGIARRHGVEDVWSINGRNWRSEGCAVFANRRTPGAPPSNIRALFPRIASHLAAAQRLRVRVGLGNPIESVEAVLAPDGQKVEHATGIASSRGAQNALRAAAICMDRARGKLRKSDPDRALDGWKGMVAARWTLLDHFESDGRRYILARENEPAPASLPVLSARERQVLANLALGRSNKEIAYALGLAHSTVRVLITRAARKLRASTRAQLVQRFEALGRNGA